MTSVMLKIGYTLPGSNTVYTTEYTQYIFPTPTQCTLQSTHKVHLTWILYIVHYRVHLTWILHRVHLTWLLHSLQYKVHTGYTLPGFYTEYTTGYTQGTPYLAPTQRTLQSTHRVNFIWVLHSVHYRVHTGYILPRS